MAGPLVTGHSMSAAAKDMGQGALGENLKIWNSGYLMCRISVGRSVFQVSSFSVSRPQPLPEILTRSDAPDAPDCPQDMALPPSVVLSPAIAAPACHHPARPLPHTRGDCGGGSVQVRSLQRHNALSTFEKAQSNAQILEFSDQEGSV